MRGSTRRDAAPEIIHVDFGIARQKRNQPLCPGARRLARRRGGIEQLLQPDLDAFQQHLILVAEIVVDRRLRHAQPCRDVVQRRLVESLFVEHLHRCAQNGIALGGVIGLALFGGGEGRGLGGQGEASRNEGPS